MRHLDIMVPQRWLLSEAKARIDHPEDSVFDDGILGAKRALSALVYAADKPHTVTIKWDGSVALLFGIDEEGFTLTDKAGFASKKLGTMPRSSDDLDSMLFMRKPNDPGRQEYAKSIARLFKPLQKMLPHGFLGYLQADVLWLTKPPLIDGNYVFKPLKTTYKIPADSELGKKIAKSSIGISIHSKFDSRYGSEAEPIGALANLHLRPVYGLVVMGPEIRDLQRTPIPDQLEASIDKMITAAAKHVNPLLDKSRLAANKITDFADIMKRYVAKRAESGQPGLEGAAAGFEAWLQTPASQLTDKKRANMHRWIREHSAGYHAVWEIAAALLSIKEYIRHDVDKQVSRFFNTELKGKPGHEGYVVDTPHGKYKVVNRPVFMHKDETP